MPMVAEGVGGLLDATLPALGAGVAWESIHRVRPRPQLRCPACAAPLHAKTSALKLRFFAHDPGSRACPLTGETLEHRLLKSALAAAVRLAGWHAALEVSAPDRSWRADVLATSPDGARSVAWEAQLAYQHEQDTAERTSRYTAAGIETVWVFDRPAKQHTPMIMIRSDDPGITVTGPVIRFAVSRCDTASRCRHYRDVREPPSCPGHGEWEPVTLPLDRFVALNCQNAIQWCRTWELDTQEPPAAAPAWTSPTYLRRAQALRKAQQDADAPFVEARRRRQLRTRLEVQRRQQEQERRRANRANLQRRQTALVPAACRRVAAEAGQQPWALPYDPEHAMGVSLMVNSRPVAVVCPVASRITREVAQQLLGLTVYVENDGERNAIARKCLPRQRIVVLQVAADQQGSS